MSVLNFPVQSLDARSDTVEIVQLTDSHLSREAGGELLGVNTDASLQAVIEQVKADGADFDLLLATGDISDHGSEESYRRFHNYIDGLGQYSFWIPGNHDDRAAMEAAVGDIPHLSRELLIGSWQILMLDSQKPGEVGGYLGPEELVFMEEALRRAEQAGLYTLICLHHQPVAIGSAWIDEQKVEDAPAFFEVTSRFDGARAVLWGHVHQEVDRIEHNLRLLATPSTCVQFAPRAENFKADTLNPGYRWLRLGPTGHIETGVERVQGMQFDVDLDSGGYL